MEEYDFARDFRMRLNAMKNHSSAEINQLMQQVQAAICVHEHQALVVEQLRKKRDAKDAQILRMSRALNANRHKQREEDLTETIDALREKLRILEEQPDDHNESAATVDASTGVNKETMTAEQRTIELNRLHTKLLKHTANPDETDDENFERVHQLSATFIAYTKWLSSLAGNEENGPEALLQKFCAFTGDVIGSARG